MIIQTLLSDPFVFLAWVVALLLGLTVHEFSHAWVAYKLGDPTAKYAGRLTLNPLKHLDPFGTILLFLVGFGWGKPVPFNPYNLKNQKYGPALVAIAGPLSNFVLAITFGLLLRFLVAQGASQGFILLLTYIVFLNVILGVFNLVPIPPLDGSKLLALFISPSLNQTLERYGLLLLVFFIFFAFPIIWPIILGVFNLIVGHPIGFL